jgi:hypothetical protein
VRGVDEGRAHQDAARRADRRAAQAIRPRRPSCGPGTAFARAGGRSRNAPLRRRPHRSPSECRSRSGRAAARGLRPRRP